MNFLTYSYVISLYPALTFIKKAALTNNRHSSPSDDAIRKYKRHRWKYVGERSSPQLDYRGDTRKVGDEHCWVVKLFHNAREYHHLEGNTWSLGFTHSSRIRMDCGVLTSPFLVENYCVDHQIRYNLPPELHRW